MSHSWWPAATTDKARRRAASEDCSGVVEFQVADLDDFGSPTQFHALVGRFVLQYQPDPAADTDVPGRRSPVAHRRSGWPQRGARGSALFSWLSTAMLAVEPQLRKKGIELPAGVTFDDTLAERLETAVVEQGSQILGPIQYGTWTRLP
jgi:hypothetical protein